MRLGTIVISTAGGKTEIKNVDKNDGKDLGHIVRARLGGPSPTSAVPAGVASLEQLASSPAGDVTAPNAPPAGGLPGGSIDPGYRLVACLPNRPRFVPVACCAQAEPGRAFHVCPRPQQSPGRVRHTGHVLTDRTVSLR